LTELRDLKSLTWLDFDCLSIEPAELDALKELKTLKTLFLRRRSVEESDLEERKKSLPKCKVIVH